MANKPREQVQREINLIRGLQDKGLDDDQIINELKIEARTYRRYKQRIMKDIAKIWEKENKDAALFRYAKFHKTLEDCYNINLKIVNNPNASFRDKQESSKIMVTCQAQLAKLARDGPIFTPALPNKVIPIEGQEARVR